MGVGAIALAATTDSDVTVGVAVVQPGQTRVVQFFGRYVGTVRRPGMSWVLPLTLRFSVSVRVRNFETNHLKLLRRAQQAGPLPRRRRPPGS